MLDNRLGLAILRRLDRLAEGGVCVSARDLPFSSQCRSPARRSESFDWTSAIKALQTGDDEGVAHALALIEGPALSLSKGDKVEEVEAPRGGHDEPEEIDLHDRCCKDGIDGNWLTDFPPPQGFSGYQSCDYGDREEKYERACTGEEVAILEAHMAAERGAALAEEEALRDEWFALLKAEADAEPA